MDPMKPAPVRLAEALECVSVADLLLILAVALGAVMLFAAVVRA